MPRRISIAPHLSTEELGRADHQAQESLESRQYQIIALVTVVRTQFGGRNPWHHGENQTAQYNGECGLSTTTNISLSC
ncbi:hypothetical protein AmaxDRAFT_0514 [Limnospira maxima CS-328]|uniref:Uncharacterized protein n=1 Tax=Limnospira maxima CS-328 TaxID=513049 RepID=B5VVH3_LIMMA|nr:hypothetical protein AmaxDRAFT_0514 [Limnospira maxima CS-328]